MDGRAKAMNSTSAARMMTTERRAFFMRLMAGSSRGFAECLQIIANKGLGNHG
jgi:hypothetical protein